MSLFSRLGEGGEAGAARILAVLILVFCPLSFAYNGLATNASPSLKNDFTSYYVAGLAVSASEPGALYYPEPVGSLLAQASLQHPWIDLARPAGIENPNYYLYPPLFAILFAPMTLLPYKVAYVAWAGLGTLFLLASVVMGLSIFEGGVRGVCRTTRGLLAVSAVILVTCLFYPVSRNFAVGQSSLLLLMLMTGALVTLRARTRRGDVLAGLCLALGILLKLTPLVFIPWLVLRRRWRALGFCAAALGLLVALSLAVVGLEPHITFVGRMLPQLAGGTAFYPNQSLAGVLERWGGGNHRLADLVPASGLAPLMARWLGTLLILITLAQIARMRAGGGADPETDDRAFGLLVLVSLAASPISWEHHYVLALIPACVLIRDATQKGWFTSRRAALAGAGLALAGSYVGVRVIEGFGTGTAPLLLGATGLAGGLLIWLALISVPLNPPNGRQKQKALAPAALLSLMTVFAAGTLLFKIAEYSRTYGQGDFTSYYVAAATLREGEGRPLYYPDTQDMILARAITPSQWTETAARWGVTEANYYLYPPFFAMAMIPLTFISFKTAHAAWYLANLAAIAGVVWSYARGRARGREQWARPEIALTVVAIALSWPALFTFGAGQANFVVLLLLVSAFFALRDRREIAAGLLLAAAVAIKLTPVLLLAYLAWRRRWVALASATAALGVLVLAGAAAAGWGSYTTYLQEMMPLLSRGCDHWINESLAAFFGRLSNSGSIFSWAIGDPSLLSRVLAGSAGLALMAGAFILMGGGRGSASLELEFALLVVTTLLVSPLSWTHHSVLSLIGLLAAARWLIARSLVTHVTAGVLAVSFLLIHIHVKPPGLFEQSPLRVLASYNLAGNLLLWGVLAILVRASRRGEGVETA